MKKAITKIFHYIEPIWSGSDGKISLRSTAAIALVIDFISNMSHAVYRWDSSRSLEGLALILSIEAGLIAATLGLTTIQNIYSRNAETTNKTTLEINKVTSGPNPPSVSGDVEQVS